MAQCTNDNYDALCRIAGSKNVLKDEPMARHTSFRIGGPASIFVTPENKEVFCRVVDHCIESNTEYFILGNGSNLLVSDNGYDGVIINTSKCLSEITLNGTRIYAEAGALLSKIASVALGESLEGFEFASGIPGTLGGAVMMNAGAYGGEMKDVLVSVEVYDPSEKRIVNMPAYELELGYRTSVFKKAKKYILSAVIELKLGESEKIKSKMDEFKASRTEKQPLNLPSAGSAFKRPEGHFAGKLIMDAGLRGFSIGDAAVSQKHCGFFVNLGNATAADMKKLFEEVIKKVDEKYGVVLEPEVKFLGRF